MSVLAAVWLTAGAAAPTGDGVSGWGSPPLAMYCGGTEPFWSLSIGMDEWANYKDDLEETRLRIVRIENAAGRPSTWRVTFAEKSSSHALIFDEQPACSDSDSDTPPEFGIFLERGGGVLRGCCRRGWQ